MRWRTLAFTLSDTYVTQTIKLCSRSTSYMRANFVEGLLPRGSQCLGAKFREEVSVLEQSHFSASTERVFVCIRSVQIWKAKSQWRPRRLLAQVQDWMQIAYCRSCTYSIENFTSVCKKICEQMVIFIQSTVGPWNFTKNKVSNLPIP